MKIDDPLPLIPYEDPMVLEDQASSGFPLGLVGYSLLVSTWLLFTITINTFFEIWKFIIAPLQLDGSTIDLYNRLFKWLTIIDAMVFKLWNIYIVIWWWAIISWCGLKLFRHSKGGGR